MEKFLITSKMQLDWPEDNLFVQGIAINHKTAKLILSMIMASSSFLLNAGSISVRLINNNNKCRIEISAKDKNIRINQNSIDILDKQVDKSAITNKNIHFYLIRRLSKLLNIDSFVEIKDQQADFIAQLP